MSSSYSLLDFGSGQRLEQWGEFRLIRPDPTALDSPSDPSLWTSADAQYIGEKGKGEWRKNGEMPEQWEVTFGDIKLITKLAPYKHTGVFPEQQGNWQWARELSKNRALTVLNLFAYTGGATVALARDGHHITHVDASKPAISWAKENAELNQLSPDRVRWMLEDAPLFVSRELKRGKKYDAIIIDPPAFGHSPSGSTWRVERDLRPLLENCAMLLSDTPAFIILNGYAKHDTPESFHRLLTGILHSKTSHKNFRIEAADLMLHAEDGRTLSTGSRVRCSFSS